MACVAVNKNGIEVIGDDLVRCRYNKHWWLEPITIYHFPKEEATEWASIYDDPDEGYRNIAIELPKGTIKHLIGRELTWEDEPFCLKDGLPYIELLFQYKSIWYCERIYPYNIDPNHYENMWDYWFGNSTEDDEPELAFEVTANKVDGQFTLDNLYINVYENDEANTPIAVITEFAYRKSWIDCKGFR